MTSCPHDGVTGCLSLVELQVIKLDLPNVRRCDIGAVRSLSINLVNNTTLRLVVGDNILKWILFPAAIGHKVRHSEHLSIFARSPENILYLAVASARLVLLRNILTTLLHISIIHPNSCPRCCLTQ